MPPQQQPAAAAQSQTPPTPAISFGAWSRLGSRTYWLFVLERLAVTAIFIGLGILFSVSRGISSMPKQVEPFLALGGIVSFLIALVAFGIDAAISWFLYRSHQYCLEEDAVKVRQGVISKEEIAIPYRHIEDVTIERSVLDQFLGLSRLVILTAGHEDEIDKKKNDESEGILPAMDRHLASMLQEELLKRADVQRVVEAK